MRCRSAVALIALLLGPTLGPLVAGPAPPSAPVVVELFTSQGCSSCPPADELLRRLGHEPGVVALSYHVDYWNRLGWKDPFSDRRWSDHQESYARAFRSNTIYTPMMVIDGRHDVVGSKTAAVRQAIADREAARSTTRLRVDVRTVAGVIEASIHVTTQSKLPAKTDVVLLVYENGQRTKVTTGENARRTLHNDFVVRERVVASLREGEMILRQKISADWSRGALGVAVLVQERVSRHIVAAEALALAAN